MQDKFTKRIYSRPYAIAILCVFLSLAAVCCKHDAGQKGDLTSQPAAEEKETKKLLPGADEVGGWKPEGKPRVFSGQSLFEHIDGGADIYHEYGFITLVTQHYDKDDKAVSIEIYCMKDAPAAFGIYSYNRHPSFSPVEIGGEGIVHPNGLYLWQARYYVDIRQVGPLTVPNEDLMALARAVTQKMGTTAVPPAIIGLLPAKDKVARTEVFARGKLGINNQVYVADDDLFGFGEEDAAAIARYSIGRTECSVIIAEYSREEAAREAFQTLRGHFLGSQSAKESEFVAAAMPAKYHGVRKLGKRLFVVANADSPERAIEMLGRIPAQ